MSIVAYKIELELNNHVAARMTMITRMSIVGIRNPSPLGVEKGFYAPTGRIPGFSLQKRYQRIKMYSNGERMVLQRDLLRQCYQTFDVKSIQGLVSENLDVLDNETSLHILCYLADHAKKSQLVIDIDDDCDQLVAALCGQVHLEELTTVSSAALVWTLEVLPHDHGHSWRRRLLVNIVTRELERDEFDQYSTRELLNFTMSCSNLSTNVGVDRRVVRFMAAVLSELSSRLEKPHVRSAFGGSEFADLASSVAALFVACHESGVQEGCKVVNGFMTSLSAEVRRKLSNRHSSARSFNPKELKQFLMAYVSVHSRDDTLNSPCMLDTVASFVASRIKSKHLNAVSRIEDVAAVLEFFTFFSHKSLAVVDLFSSSGYQLRLLSASALDTMTQEEPGNVGENHARATAAHDVNWIGALASILQCHIKMGYRPNDTTLIALVPAVKYHQVAARSHDKAALLRAFDILDFNCGRNLTQLLQA
mmetsp:Transcript_3431/g.6946  ORF Transcript_3431/g.6946 Transcript_3431/m.6946 type:complete len:477 (+) Transcript_3431:1971-3401(+)